MSVNVSLTMGQFPISYCWTNPQTFANDLVALITAIISGNFSGIIISQTLPAPTDQDKAWLRLNSDGTPDRLYKYLGGWLSKHPVDPSSSFRWIWVGSESALWAADGGDGTNPNSVPPTATTGAMWQRDTVFGADDGTSIFKVPIGIGLNPTGYNGQAATSIGVGSTGGVEKVQLALAEIPPNTQTIHCGNVEHGAADTRVFQPTTADGQPDLTSVGMTNQTNPNNYHQTMPPYYGVIFAKRTVRSFYVGT